MTDFITLKKGDLEIQVLTPHSPIYNRTRFNHAGFIPSIQYKGVQFAEPEQRDPSRQTSGGAGLCSQFFFTEAEQQAKEGEAFLRMGIGVMTREKELIHFMRDAAFDPLQILMDVGDDSVLFTTTSPEVNGYAYDEVRLVELSGNSLRISVSLTNRGKKPISTTEYNHNFVSLGGLPIGPDYHLELPYCRDVDRMKDGCGLVQDGQGVSWAKAPERPFYCEFHDIAPSAPYAWKLTNKKSKASMMEVIDFVPEHITVWGVEHCACAEVFAPFSVEPMQTARWTRKWFFEA